MAQAMTLPAQNSVALPHSTHTSSQAPDTFDGFDLSKFTTFMSQIYLHIVECLQDFLTDKKIFYVRLILPTKPSPTGDIHHKCVGDCVMGFCNVD
jgi:hypothetical protein